jgi:hypothetical protein
MSYYAFDAKYPDDPIDEKQWISFLDKIRSYKQAENATNHIGLYQSDGDQLFAFVKLLNFRFIGDAMAAQVSKHNYRQVPTFDGALPTPAAPKMCLFNMPILRHGECWELFVGNLEDPDDQHHYILGSYDEALVAFHTAMETAPHYSAYILRHYFASPNSFTSTTDYIPLKMPFD